MKSRTKLKTSDKPATPRKVAIAKLVPSSEPNIDDEAEERAARRRAVARAARFRSSKKSRATAKASGLRTSASWWACTIPPPSTSPRRWSRSAIMRQERDSKRYRVGRPLFALAASALDEIEMVNLATPILEDLSRETGESGHFAVRMGDAVVVIARTSGRRRVSIDRPRRRGAPRALHGARQDHPRLAAPRSIEALPRTGRTEALDQEVDHRTGRAAARDRRDPPRARSPSTTANSMPKCAASQCRSIISPAK